MKVVLDANVYLSALFSPHGVCAKVLRKLANSHRYQLVVSDGICSEMEDCLSRPKTLKATNLPAAALLDWFETLRTTALHIENPGYTLGICRDPKDEIYLSTALASKSSYLVTGDKDLLVLEAVEQTLIVGPTQFLNIVDSML